MTEAWVRTAWKLLGTTAPCSVEVALFLYRRGALWDLVGEMMPGGLWGSWGLPLVTAQVVETGAVELVSGGASVWISASGEVEVGAGACSREEVQELEEAVRRVVGQEVRLDALRERVTMGDVLQRTTVPGSLLENVPADAPHEDASKIAALLNEAWGG